MNTTFTRAEIAERTTNLQNIFKFIVRLNPNRFYGWHPMTIAEIIYEFADVEPDTIDVKQLVEYIDKYYEGMRDKGEN